MYAKFCALYGGACSTSACSGPGIVTRSRDATNRLSSGSCRRAPATAPPCGLWAFALSAHSRNALPGAYLAQTLRSASRLRPRSASPISRRRASGTRTCSVAASIFVNVSSPSANSCVAPGRCATNQSASACIAFDASALASFSWDCSTSSCTVANTASTSVAKNCAKPPKALTPYSTHGAGIGVRRLARICRVTPGIARA